MPVPGIDVDARRRCRSLFVLVPAPCPAFVQPVIADADRTKIPATARAFEAQPTHAVLCRIRRGDVEMARFGAGIEARYFLGFYLLHDFTLDCAVVIREDRQRKKTGRASIKKRDPCNSANEAILACFRSPVNR